MDFLALLADCAAAVASGKAAVTFSALALVGTPFAEAVGNMLAQQERVVFALEPH